MKPTKIIVRGKVSGIFCGFIAWESKESITLRDYTKLDLHTWDCTPEGLIKNLNEARPIKKLVTINDVLQVQQFSDYANILRS